MGKFDVECQPSILTHSGKAFDLVDQDADNVDIEDIAYSLGRLCRYAGHTDPFYSVAEHCVIVSKLVPPEVRLHGLLHDSPETYLIDLPGPVKGLISGYKELECKVSETIYRHLGLKLPTQEILDTIKTVDIRLYLTERNQLLPPPPRPWVWDGLVDPFDYSLSCWSPEIASLMYLEVFDRLRKEYRR